MQFVTIFPFTTTSLGAYWALAATFRVAELQTEDYYSVHRLFFHKYSTRKKVGLKCGVWLWDRGQKVIEVHWMMVDNGVVWS